MRLALMARWGWLAATEARRDGAQTARIRLAATTHLRRRDYGPDPAAARPSRI
jgi:hypothetical protein